VLSTSKKVSAEIASFYADVSFVNAPEPTGGCTPDQVLSLMIARHLGRMRAEVETLSLVASAATFPSTGGSSAAGNKNNDVNNNNNKSRNNDNNIPDNDDDDEDCVSPQ
jgi:hypothetical protein